jgi:hypothetical protein
VTVNVSPAMVNVPVRSPPVFAATLNVTVPLPLPLEPVVTVIQLALLTAVQAQPDCVVTATGPPVPPEALNVWLVGAMAYVHVVCEIVTVCPATVRLPVRAPPVFGWTEYVTLPPPVLLAPLRIVTQFTWLAAVHAQPDDVDTEIGVPVPPAGAMETFVGVTE